MHNIVAQKQDGASNIMQKATIVNHDLGRELTQDKQEQDETLHNWIANSRQPTAEHHCQDAYESHAAADAKTHFATSSSASSERLQVRSQRNNDFYIYLSIYILI